MRQRHEVLDEVERLYRCPPGESVIHGWQERDDLSRLLLSSKSATGYRGCSSPPRARRAIHDRHPLVLRSSTAPVDLAPGAALAAAPLLQERDGLSRRARCLWHVAVQGDVRQALLVGRSPALSLDPTALVNRPTRGEIDGNVSAQAKAIWTSCFEMHHYLSSQLATPSWQLHCSSCQSFGTQLI